MENLVTEKYNELAFYTLGLRDECFIHQYIVDAFTAQNSTIETKSISLTFALVGLYLFIEKGYTGKEVQAFHTLMSSNKLQWPIFILPINRGEITIETVLEVKEQEERNLKIKSWCQSVWNAFSECSVKIKEIADYYIEIKTTNR